MEMRWNKWFIIAGVVLLGGPFVPLVILLYIFRPFLFIIPLFLIVFGSISYKDWTQKKKTIVSIVLSLLIWALFFLFSAWASSAPFSGIFS